MELRTVHLRFALCEKAPKRYGPNGFKVSPAEAVLLNHSGWTLLGHGRFYDYVAPPEAPRDGLCVVTVQAPTDEEILAIAMRMHARRELQRERVEGFYAFYRPAAEEREFAQFTFGFEAPWSVELIWDRGNDQQPTWHRHEKCVLQSEAALIDEIEKRKEADQLALANYANEFVAGTILLNSWGYDQTNIQYYEVIERRGMMVVIREIAAKTVPGSEGPMSDWRTPVPGHFIGPPIRKRIGPSGLTMRFGRAVIIQPNEKHRCSWYC